LEDIFRSIPRVEENSLSESLFYAAYNRNEFTFSSNTSFLKKNIKEIVNKGMSNIFILNGDLVESSGISHHYVFSSVKHSSKFLKTANVIVKKSKINFIVLKI